MKDCIFRLDPFFFGSFFWDFGIWFCCDGPIRFDGKTGNQTWVVCVCVCVCSLRPDVGEAIGCVLVTEKARNLLYRHFRARGLAG